VDFRVGGQERRATWIRAVSGVAILRIVQQGCGQPFVHQDAPVLGLLRNLRRTNSRHPPPADETARLLALFDMPDTVSGICDGLLVISHEVSSLCLTR